MIHCLLLTFPQILSPRQYPREKLTGLKPEYNDTQCDKRNTYRRRVKEEKAAAAVVAPSSDGKEGEVGEVVVIDGEVSTTNGTNGEGDANGVDAERLVKKRKVENGNAVPPEAELEEEDDDGDDEDGDGDDEEEEEEDEDEEDDGRGEESDSAEGDSALVDRLEEDEEEVEDEERGEMRDEALDEPDSD